MQLLRYLIRRIRRKSLTFLWQLNRAISPQKISTFYLEDGSRFEYPLKSALGFGLFLGEFENSEVAFVQKSLQPGDIFIDVGANGGIFTIMAAKKIQNHGHVYAFEPDERNLKLLRRNIEINKLTNITILDCALSNEKGEAKFLIATDGAMNSLAKTNHESQQIQEWKTVKVITLDDFVDEYKIDKVDFIKIDTEGAEKLIFDGAKKTFADNSQLKVMFEASDLNAVAFGYTVKDFLAEVIDSGMKLYYFAEDGVPTFTTHVDERFGNAIYNFVASKKEI